MEPTTEKKSNGALMGSIIVIVILILGGIYMWMSKANIPTDQQIQEEVQTEEQQSLGELNQAAVIEAELEAIDTQMTTEAQADIEVSKDAEATI